MLVEPVTSYTGSLALYKLNKHTVMYAWDVDRDVRVVHIDRVVVYTVST